MSFMSLKKYFPEFALCSASVFALTLAACQVGEPIRIYDSRDPPAEKPAAAAAPGKIIAPGKDTSGSAKTSTDPKPCVFHGSLPIDKDNLPELEDMKAVVKTAENLYVKRRDLRQAVVKYADGLKMSDGDRRSFVEGIMNLSPISVTSLASEHSVPTASASPSPSPTPTPEHPLHKSIAAFLIHKHSLEFAHLPVKPKPPETLRGPELSDEEARKMADTLYKGTLDTFAAFIKAFQFATDSEAHSGLVMNPTEGMAFANKVFKTPNPVQTLLNYIETFNNEIDLHSSPKEASAAAEKFTCLTHEN
jgi:hypothetical protein